MMTDLRGRARLLQRGRDQIVAGSSAVDKSEHVIVSVALAYYLDALLIFQARQFSHHKRLFRGAHVTVVDIECETG